VVVASKKFTESVILGEMVTQILNYGRPIRLAKHQPAMGGTQVLWKGLLRGDIDIYPEYTGTLEREILSRFGTSSLEDLQSHLAGFSIGMTRPLGFNNTYALAMKRSRTKSLGIVRISDLKLHPTLKFGFTEEFINRKDCWPALFQAYQLPQKDLRSIDHDLAYRGIASGDIDLLDTYSTDAEIEAYDLVILEDDLKIFPRYEAVFLYRLELQTRSPQIVASLKKFEGAISATEMVQMNSKVKMQGISEAEVAQNHLSKRFGIESSIEQVRLLARVWKYTKQHLYLVGIAVFLSILVGLPLGIFVAKFPHAGQIVLGVAGVFQTIPALALLVLMIPWLGIGPVPAIVALLLYALLPMVRNTYTGIREISPAIIESALAMGLSTQARLFKIELPLASRSILSGIKTSTIITVGGATLGALIGAGGYGEPILTGIRLDDTSFLLEGAVPAAAMALIAQLLFDLLEYWIVPKGLRFRPEEEG